uniref:Putative secreted protein n=1 Tax=Ixodes ricinus TaxID=34613 RepID=A0A6B0TUC0_IXORI
MEPQAAGSWDAATTVTLATLAFARTLCRDFYAQRPGFRRRDVPAFATPFVATSEPLSTRGRYRTPDRQVGEAFYAQ